MTNTNDRPNQAITTKRQYSAPVLTEYGAAAHLTLGGQKSGPEGGPGDPGVHHS